ncbi:MAG: single-stranded-DNA-specific exonuclease RecJ [Rhabdochlamydiaceae bacterium]|nr:single-stranded-DNA-specific exonuclease RecJ [Candidatus Amphrikana amoebophyrae]
MPKQNESIYNPIWIDPPQDSELCQKIVDDFHIHPVTAQVLVSRKFESEKKIHDFLYAKLPNLLDPNLFPEMGKAIERIFKAQNEKETILIYGDNDVDGMTGTTLLTDLFRYIGLSVLFYVASRGGSMAKSGYLNALDYAKAKNCKLMITVDCGITANEDLKTITNSGIDVIITDHHEKAELVPKVTAIINPKMPGCSYPNREITGVGVAFKLAHGYLKFLISEKIIEPSQVDLKRYLDLVALGTIADMGGLIDENRILVRYGLIQLHRTKRIGLVKLIKVSNLKPYDITVVDIASKLAPRLNSLGRIADPQKGVELLLTEDPHVAERLAKELDLKNLERQRIEKKDSEEVEILISSFPDILDQRAIVLYSHNWHPGIIPIIAARLAKQYNRPTLIITVDEGIGKGSLRTIPEFPVLPILQQRADLLLNFGGHDYAAGLTIKEENITAFKKHFIDAANTMLHDQDVLPKIYLDAKASFSDLTFDFLESLNLLEPFGNENTAPILYTTVKQVWPPKVIGRSHLKLYLEEGGRFLEGIAFGLAHRKPTLSKKNLKMKIAFTPTINNYLNKTSIQLQIRDFKILDEV